MLFREREIVPDRRTSERNGTDPWNFLRLFTRLGDVIISRGANLCVWWGVEIWFIPVTDIQELEVCISLYFASFCFSVLHHPNR